MNYNSAEEADREHIMPLWALISVWAALIGLTVLTALAAQIDLGGMNIWIAVGIATIKALLVGLFFMHLIFERLFNFFVLAAALFFVLLFIGLADMDSHAYQKDLLPEYAPQMQRQ